MSKNQNRTQARSYADDVAIVSSKQKRYKFERVCNTLGKNKGNKYVQNISDTYNHIYNQENTSVQ